VHSTTHGGEVRSCYFKGVVCTERRKENRWRVLTRLLTLTYAERSKGGTWAPKQMAVRDNTTVVQIRFRTSSSWCLDHNDPTPWELIRDPYYPSPPAPIPRKLSPRRPC
jgi:hypothetical protein